MAKTKLRLSWLRIGYIILAVLVMYVLVTHSSDLHGSVRQLKTSRLSYDLLVLIAVMLTYLLAALTYYFIAFKRLKYLRTVFVELGINTVNRLLPAGLGGIGANFDYLVKSKHSDLQSAAVVATNTILGIVGNLILLVILVWNFPVGHLKFASVNDRLLIGIGALVAVALTVSFLIPAWRKKINRDVRQIIANIWQYRSRKLKLVYGLGSQMGLTLCYVLALYFSLMAVYGHLSIGAVMLAYSFAVWLGAVIPAPGGVGSMEAGLVTGLVAFNVNVASAVAAVLIFRLISFWLPMIVGIVPLVWASKAGYL